MPLVIGLTGGLAAGKSTVSSMFFSLGADVLDADQIVHAQLSVKGRPFNQVVKAFGTEILSRGKIDRRELGRIVFKDSKQLKKIEKIVHPVVKEEIVKKINHFKKRGFKKVLIIEVPLLFESGFNRLMDYTIVVKAKEKQQLSRAVEKFGISRREALRRLRKQMPFKQKVKLADFVINNSRSLTNTKKRVKEIWQELNSKKNTLQSK